MNKRIFPFSVLTSLLLFLPSGFTWAKTTVWSCKSTEFAHLQDHQLKTYLIHDFNFAVHTDAQKINFDEDGWFEGAEHNITRFIHAELWEARQEDDIMKFNKGDFYYSVVGYNQVVTFSAKCERLEYFFWN